MRRRHAVVVLAACLAASCGGSGVTSRPIETSIFVTGAQGTQFTFGPCAAQVGSGITAPNAEHQLTIEPTPGGPSQPEIFEAPRLFVLENIQQPVYAVIQNIDPSNDIEVNLYLGQTLQNRTLVAHGECKAISTFGGASPPPTPKPSNPDVRFEVCSPIEGLKVPCVNSTDPPFLPPPDHFFSFFASVGDIKRSNVTNCTLPESQLANGCLTPATFFLERAEEEVAAAMSINPGQNPGGGIPNAELRLELYLNGVFQGYNAGQDPKLTNNNF